MNYAVVIGTWMLIAVMVIGFMAIFLAVISRKRGKKYKRKRSK